MSVLNIVMELSKFHVWKEAVWKKKNLIKFHISWLGVEGHFQCAYPNFNPTHLYNPISFFQTSLRSPFNTSLLHTCPSTPAILQHFLKFQPFLGVFPDSPSVCNSTVCALAVNYVI